MNSKIRIQAGDFQAGLLLTALIGAAFLIYPKAEAGSPDGSAVSASASAAAQPEKSYFLAPREDLYSSTSVPTNIQATAYQPSPRR